MIYPWARVFLQWHTENTQTTRQSLADFMAWFKHTYSNMGYQLNHNYHYQYFTTSVGSWAVAICSWENEEWHLLWENHDAFAPNQICHEVKARSFKVVYNPIQL